MKTDPLGDVRTCDIFNMATMLNNLTEVISYVYLRDVPWAVPEEDILTTFPPYVNQRDPVTGRYPLEISEGHLVASAEQSMIHMFRMGHLELDVNYIAYTPCFRFEDESELGDLKRRYFSKLELNLFTRTRGAHAEYFAELIIRQLEKLAASVFLRWATNDLGAKGSASVVERAKASLHDPSQPPTKRRVVIRGVEPSPDLSQASFFKIVPTDIGFDIVDTVFGFEIGSYGERSFADHYLYYGTVLAEPRFSVVMKKIYQSFII